MSHRLTAVLIARNAERTISQCVKALAFCDHVIVGENESSDRTAQLAQAAGAEVRNVNWEGYGKTKNRLIVTVTDGWVLSIDSDEIVSPALATEIQAIVFSGQAGTDGYFVNRDSYFLGKRIKHCGWSPDWQLRLFRAGQGKFEEKHVHEGLRVEGQTGRLREPLEHFTYYTLSDYIARMDIYATLAARDRLERGKRFSWTRLVFDPIWTFKRMYFFKGGWRDGMPGLLLCALSGFHTLVKHAKHWELQRDQKKPSS